MPTYKFEPRTRSYDSKKTPCWYDRVLYKTIDKSKLALLKYNDIDVYLSDHKPVYAIMNVLIKRENY